MMIPFESNLPEFRWDYRPSHRCPWCMQDVNRLGAECRICEEEEFEEPAVDPVWELPNRYWLQQFGQP